MSRLGSEHEANTKMTSESTWKAGTQTKPFRFAGPTQKCHRSDRAKVHHFGEMGYAQKTSDLAEGRYKLSQVDTATEAPDGQGTHNTAGFKDSSERPTVALLGISSWNMSKWRQHRSS